SMLSGGNSFISPFPHAYKAKLTARPLMIQMMRFKLSGGCKSWHHHQEEDEMAKACVLAFLLSGWQENGQMITISLSTHHHKAWRISKTLYHSSWPYGLSSLLIDCIKSKHLDQRQKNKPKKQMLYL